MDLTDQTINQYKIIRRIGKGGMGEVYLAEDTDLDRQVALKFLPDNLKHDRVSCERLIREAKSAAGLDHPFICKIYGTGDCDGEPFIAMEYVEGNELTERMKEGPIPVRDALRITLEIAEAIEKAQKKNIVHRDLKPANIMLTPQGHVKVMDFGLAKQVVPQGQNVSQTLTQAQLTQEGAIAGTLAYMSPEQAKGEDIDGRSDIFSLGIIFQEMLSGKHPFMRPSALETVSAILKESPVDLHVKPKKASSHINKILKHSLAKELDQRYENAEALVKDLRKVQREMSAGGKYILTGWRPAALGAVIVILAIAGTLWLQKGGDGTASVEEATKILVADFENKTEDPVFDGGAIEQTTVIALEEAPFISVYERKYARELVSTLSPNSNGVIDDSAAQLISRSEGINVIVDGSVERNGEGFEFKLWAYDSASTEHIADLSRQVDSRLDVMNAVIKLSAELVSDLKGAPVDSKRILEMETFTTTSLEAMNAYARAQYLSTIGAAEEAIQEYGKAITADPKMGRAYSGLAVIYYNMGDKEKAQEYFQQAMAHVAQMTEREKYRTRGVWFLMTGNYQKSIEEYTALLEIYPADLAAQMNLAMSYFFARDMERAVEEAHKSVKLNPSDLGARFNLSLYAIGLGDFKQAEEVAQGILDKNLDYVEAYVSYSLASIGLGKFDEALDFYNRMESLGPRGETLANYGKADLAFFQGRMEEAEQILLESLKKDEKNENKYMAIRKRIMLAQIYCTKGQSSQALPLVEQALNESSSLDVLYPAAEIYLNCGMPDKTEAIAAALEQKLEDDPQAYAKLIRARIALKSGQFANAITLIIEAQNKVDTWLGHFLKGQAFIEGKDGIAAGSEFDLCYKRRGEAMFVHFNDLPTSFYLPLLVYQTALAQAEMKSYDAAKANFQKFLEIKSGADGDPMVTDARRRLNDLL
ncbi:protein kinase [Acidobacteriota bacterium]